MHWTIFRTLKGAAFVKPLTGSRGDFAQAIHDEAALSAYLDEVLRYYDSILMQPVYSGRGIPDISARRRRGLFGQEARTLRGRRRRAHASATWWRTTTRRCESAAFQSVALTTDLGDPADAVLRKGERWAIPGRMNLSAGGTMVLESPSAERTAFALARQARKALGLRVAAVDLFTDIGGDPEAIRLIEVNANPSIRFLEQCGRPDLILKIWHHTFSAMGLFVV